LAELGIELIKARSPQAKGRVERSFGTAQDRWVKELRLAKARTRDQANAVLERLIPDHNRRFGVAPREASDAHRSLGDKHRLGAILSIQAERVVSNDYTIRFQNRFYQLLQPVYPGERGGRVVIEERRNGTMALRFRGHYLKYREIGVDEKGEAAAGSELEFNAFTADARATKRDRDPLTKSRSPGIQPTAGRSGRTPAEPYPPDGEAGDNPKPSRRPAENHPWRKKML
jgi:hypothetical protein